MKEAPPGLAMGLHRASPPLSIKRGKEKSQRFFFFFWGGTWGCFIKQRPPCLSLPCGQSRRMPPRGPQGHTGLGSPLGSLWCPQVPVGDAVGPGSTAGCSRPPPPQQTWAELPPPTPSCAGGPQGMPHPPPPPADAKRGKKGNFSTADPIALHPGCVPYPSHATSALQRDFSMGWLDTEKSSTQRKAR